MKGTIFGFFLALGLVCFSQVRAQEGIVSAQDFLYQPASKASSKQGYARQARVQRTQTASLEPGFNFTLGGSWLEANLGAARPHGAPGPWCGYAMRLEVVAMGRPDPGPAYNAVSSWHNYGTPAPRAAVGSLFISRGHISKVVAGECPPGRVRTISGNAAGARVSYMCEPLSSLVVSRWP
ncbi:MAG: hypothetical protein AB7O46_12430 [Xanthobacteraceae bacterium]